MNAEKQIHTLAKLEKYLDCHRKIEREIMSTELIQLLQQKTEIVISDIGSGGSLYRQCQVELETKTIQFSYAIFDPDEWPDHFTYGLTPEYFKQTQPK